MDLSIAANNKVELSTVYSKGVVNEPLHFGISENQNNFTKYVRPDTPAIKDNLPTQSQQARQPKTLIGTEIIGSRNLADLWTLEFRSIDEGIHGVSSALLTKLGNGTLIEPGAYGNETRRSLLDMSKIFEDELTRLKSLTDITEDERASRIYLLERGFADAAYWQFIEPAGTSRDMKSLVNFATNAANNIDVTGLKDETKNLLFEGLSRAVSGTFHSIQNKAMGEAITRYLKSNKLKNRNEKTMTDEDAKRIRYKAELFKLSMEAIKKLDWLSLGNLDGRNRIKDDVINIYYKEVIIEESADEETSPEVSDTDDSHEETMP